MLELKEITKEDECSFVEFERRYKKESKDEKIPFSMNPKNLEFKDFFKELESCKHIETLPNGFVLAKYFLIWVDGRIVGGINLRLGNTDFILNEAGHIGYGIAPWERKKGYAKLALKKLLILAMDLGMKDFVLTADLDNIASQKVILSCGGRFDKIVEGKRIYYIHLEEWKKEESAMAIVFCKDKILATKEIIYGDIVLSCPKGHIEGKETPIETAIRECYEETNVLLQKSDVVKEFPFYQIKFMDPHNRPILKRFYPIFFKITKEGAPKIKEEQVIEILYMEISEFLSCCNYENVKEIVRTCLRENNL